MSSTPITALSQIDPPWRGLIETVSDRLDGHDDALLAWGNERGFEEVRQLAHGGDDDIDTYFQLLYDEDSDAALDFIGGDSMYAKTVGRACDRVEDAFVAWLEDRAANAPLPPLGPRSRVSSLAERALVTCSV